MAMQSELTDAAVNFRKQLSEGIQPDIGAMVLLVHQEGIGMNTNIPKERLVAILEAVLQRVKQGEVGLIVPAGRA